MASIRCGYVNGSRRQALRSAESRLEAGAPSVRFAATQDIDEQAALLSGWNQTYDQISQGAFDGHLIDLAIGPVRLFREVTGTALQQSGALPADLIAVGVPMSLSGPATFCGKACDGQQLHVFSGNDQFEFFSPRGLDIVGFVVQKSDLFGSPNDNCGCAMLDEAPAPHLKDIDRQHADILRRLFIEVLQVVSQHADRAARADVQCAMLDDVYAAILTATASNADDDACRDAAVSSKRRAAIVSDVHDLVFGSPENYQNIEALCGTLGVSRRTLQHAFHDTLGIKPSAYLRAVRLNGARRSIKQGSSVTDAATEWGFWHFGRFAHDYRVMFGELPSETAGALGRHRERVS